MAFGSRSLNGIMDATAMPCQFLQWQEQTLKDNENTMNAYDLWREPRIRFHSHITRTHKHTEWWWYWVSCDFGVQCWNDHLIFKAVPSYFVLFFILLLLLISLSAVCSLVHMTLNSSIASVRTHRERTQPKMTYPIKCFTFSTDHCLPLK